MDYPHVANHILLVRRLKNKADLASAIARRWYDVEGVDMITDLTLSSVALAVQGIAAEKKKIDIVVASSTPVLRARPARPSASTGPMTRTRSRSRRVARW